MPTTIENLKEAFAGESQANQKYRAFAKKAKKEGMPNIAKLVLNVFISELALQCFFYVICFYCNFISAR